MISAVIFCGPVRNVNVRNRKHTTFFFINPHPQKEKIIFEIAAIIANVHKIFYFLGTGLTVA